MRACLLAVALAMTGSAAGVAGDLDHERARAALRAGEVMPLRQVLGIVHDQFRGDMVEAELERKGPFWVYEITVLTPGGTVLKLYYDAAQGDLLRAKGHNLQSWYRGNPDDLAEVQRRHRERRQARDDSRGDRDMRDERHHRREQGQMIDARKSYEPDADSRQIP